MTGEKLQGGEGLLVISLNLYCLKLQGTRRIKFLELNL